MTTCCATMVLGNKTMTQDEPKVMKVGLVGSLERSLAQSVSIVCASGGLSEANPDVTCSAAQNKTTTKTS